MKLLAIVLLACFCTPLVLGFTHTAVLRGLDEVPQVRANTILQDSCLALLEYAPNDNVDGGQLKYRLWCDVGVADANDNDPMAGVHIHKGLPGVNGDVLFTITDDSFSRYTEGSFKLDKEQQQWLMSGHLYVNVHSREHPGGRLRGQIVHKYQQSVVISSAGGISGSTALGHALVDYNPYTHLLTLTVSHNDSPTAAHIHGPAAPPSSYPIESVNDAGVVYTVDGSQSATIQRQLPLALELAFTSGEFYINYHTDANPGGSIRGTLDQMRTHYTLLTNANKQTGVALFTLRPRAETLTAQYLHTLPDATAAPSVVFSQGTPINLQSNNRPDTYSISQGGSNNRDSRLSLFTSQQARVAVGDLEGLVVELAEPPTWKSPGEQIQDFEDGKGDGSGDDTQSGGGNGGKVAAGILIPLIFIGLGVLAYIKRDALRSKFSDLHQRFNDRGNSGVVYEQQLDNRASSVRGAAYVAPSAASTAITSEAGSTKGPTLPLGWEMFETDQGQPYYVHSGTNQTQWQFPTA